MFRNVVTIIIRFHSGNNTPTHTYMCTSHVNVCGSTVCLSVYLAFLWLVLQVALWLPVYLAPDPLDCIEVTWSFPSHHSAGLGILHSHCWAVFGRQGLWTCQMCLLSQEMGEYHHRYQTWGNY